MDETADGEHSESLAKLNSLLVQCDELGDRCLFRSEVRVAREARRLARAEQKFYPYVRATFAVMNHSADLLEPEVQRDMALELISLLEDETAARKIQPDLDDGQYEYLKHWYSACAYDNFAKSVGNLNGYNSEGLHACIQDGIQVCRRTAKTQCVRCFREYAIWVYKAADDLDMALHFARMSAAHVEPGAHDRRWAGAKEEAKLLLCQGDLSAAWDAEVRAWSLRHSYHNPHNAEAKTRNNLALLSLLLDRQSEFARVTALSADDPKFTAVDYNEFPYHQLEVQSTEAVAGCLSGRFDEAIPMLKHWDATLRKQKYLSEWFELRLQLLATLKMAGRDGEIRPLADQLRTAALTARDFLTLRLLERVLAPTTPRWPVVCLTDHEFASPVTVTASERDADENPAPPSDGAAAENAAEQIEVKSPLDGFVDGLRRRLFPEDETVEPDFSGVAKELLLSEPESVVDWRDAYRLLRIAQICRGTANDVATIQSFWNWAQGILKGHSRERLIVCQVAVLGSMLSERLREMANAATENSESAASAEPEWLTTKQISAMFRELTDQHVDHAEIFGYAGSHALSIGDDGEAERCFARAFRLDRTYSEAALRLAEVYNRTDRRRDALAALDLCLREGAEDPDVAWEAAITAHGLGQYEAAVAYLDRHDSWLPDRPWSNYYRAAALLELNRPEESLAATEKEMGNNSDGRYPSRVQQAAALAQLNRLDECREAMREVIATPLTRISFMSPNGLAAVHRRLWLSLASAANELPEQNAYATFLVASGLAPDELFDGLRKVKGAEPRDSQRFYRVTIKQPLPTNWSESVPCRYWETNWTSMLVIWGVVAASEEEAGSYVLPWHQRAFSTPGEVAEVEVLGDEFSDTPGVVWLGQRDAVGE